MNNWQGTEFARFLLETSDYKRIFITGRAKSGTSWLDRMLRAHPQVAMLGERKLLERTGQYEPLLRPLLTGDLLSRWHSYSTVRHRREFDGLPQELARLISDYLLHLVVDHRGATHFGDKIALVKPQDVSFAFKAIQDLYGDCRIVNIVRDGRDSVVSGQFHRYRNALRSGNLNERAQRIDQVVKGEAERLFADNEVRNMARSWNKIVHNADQLGPKLFGDAFLSIRYEDLKADTPGMTKKILAHFGLHHDEETVRQVNHAASFKRRAKGRAEGIEDPTSRLRKGTSGDWRNYFTRRDAQLFARVANEMLLAHGYEEDPKWFRTL